MAFLTVWGGSVAEAQSVAAQALLPRVFLGAGVAAGGTDEGSRMRLFEDGSPWLGTIEGGVKLTSRVGLGAELLLLPAATAATSGMSFRASGRQEERALLGALRARLAASGRLALDVMGGAGVLWQHHESSFANCFTCEESAVASLDRRGPVFAVGADVPVAVSRRVGFAGTARLYWFQRGDHQSAPPELIRWQFETLSSTRLVFGVTGRVNW